MKKCVIVIARQFGSLGRSVARRLSEVLDIPYYDRDIVEKAARESGKTIKIISDKEEKANYFYMRFPLGHATTEEQDEIFAVESRIIEELAEKESCIIVGRCADYVLRGRTDCVKIFIYASYEQKLKNCVDILKLDEKDAARMIRDVDKAREAYHKRYTGYGLDDREAFDMAINSSLLGVEGTAGYIAELVRMKYI